MPFGLDLWSELWAGEEITCSSLIIVQATRRICIVQLSGMALNPNAKLLENNLFNLKITFVELDHQFSVTHKNSLFKAGVPSSCTTGTWPIWNQALWAVGTCACTSTCTSGRLARMHPCAQLNLCKLNCAHMHVNANLLLTQVKLRVYARAHWPTVHSPTLL